MKKLLLSLCLGGMASPFCDLSCRAQVTIDGTVAPVARLREPGLGIAGSNGNVLPLSMSMKVVTPATGIAHMATVEFTLKNVGTVPIILPISPNPRDIEPKDPETSYSDKVLGLAVETPSGSPTFLAGGAELYGTDRVPGTLLTLKPGSSAKILVNEALPSDLTMLPENAVKLVGFLLLSDEIVRIVAHRPISELNTIGTADTRNLPARGILY